MGQLIRYELEKMIGRKMVWAALLLLLFYNGIYLIRIGTGEAALTTEGELLEGRDAIRYMQEYDRRYGGALTDEKLEEIRGSYAEEVRQEMEDDYFLRSCAVDLFRYVESRFGEQEGEAETFTPEMGEIRLGYHEGFSFFHLMMKDLMALIGCILIITITPMFAEEYGKGTDALILSAKYGKTKGAKAKAAAAFIFSVLLYGGIAAVNSIFCLSVFGTEGWDTSIQVDWIGYYWELPYEMNYGRFTVYWMLLGMVACLLLTGVALLLSAYCASSFAAVIFAAAYFFLPLWLRMPDGCKIFMPFLQMLQKPLELGYINVLGHKIMPLWIAAVLSTAATVFFGIRSEKTFSVHQVK